MPRKFPTYTTGPGGVLNKPKDVIVGPGDPPPNFVTATTSLSEWIWYWASAKVYNDPKDPRQVPYWGGEKWGYQVAQQGGRQVMFGAVVDFIYYLPGQTIGIRIQTARFHEEAGPTKRMTDQAQRMYLSRWITIMDVYEQDYIADRTGEAACRLLVQTLGGRKRFRPSAIGTYRQVRALTI
jgi:hypothetical protein